MRFTYILHIIGAFSIGIGLCMVPALIVSLLYGDGMVQTFAASIALSLGIGGGLFLGFRGRSLHEPMNHREGMAITAFGWIAAGLLGAIPFWLSGAFPSLTDCAFESFSGFTTTGSSILSDIEALPKSILFWRSLTHWLGGMGIIVLSIAVLPFLGVGGMQLYKAEVPGPVPDKLRPRIRDTAMALWQVYVLFSVAEALLLWAGGMELFDAVCHTFGTMATGGFSTKNNSIGFYDSAYIQWVITAFMLLAGINFTLHFHMLRGKPLPMWRDTEFRGFMSIFAVVFVVFCVLVYDHNYATVEESARYAAFQAASILTTTGFATTDYELWPMLAQVILLLLMFIGGCAGSTGGGMKVMRLMLLQRFSMRELFKLVHPRAVSYVKFGGKVVDDSVLSGIWGFFLLWLALFCVGAFLVAASGVDVLTAFSASLACIGNIGPGLGMVGPTENFGWMPDFAKWSLIFCMVLGRLEIYTVIILLVPEFWRK